MVVGVYLDRSSMDLSQITKDYCENAQLSHFSTAHVAFFSTWKCPFSTTLMCFTPTFSVRAESEIQANDSIGT